jgi:hypothetical protein
MLQRSKNCAICGIPNTTEVEMIMTSATIHAPSMAPRQDGLFTAFINWLSRARPAKKVANADVWTCGARGL